MSKITDYIITQEERENRILENNNSMHFVEGVGLVGEIEQPMPTSWVKQENLFNLLMRKSYES
jgi:hypothetical protein